jgi:hypothetical protein
MHDSCKAWFQLSHLFQRRGSKYLQGLCTNSRDANWWIIHGVFFIMCSSIASLCYLIYTVIIFVLPAWLYIIYISYFLFYHKLYILTIKNLNYKKTHGLWVFIYIPSEVIHFIYTCTIVSLNPAHDKVYLIQHYVIKFVSDLWQVGGFIQVFRFPPSIKLIAMEAAGDMGSRNVSEGDIEKVIFKLLTVYLQLIDMKIWIYLLCT